MSTCFAHLGLEGRLCLWPSVWLSSHALRALDSFSRPRPLQPMLYGLSLTKTSLRCLSPEGAFHLLAMSQKWLRTQPVKLGSLLCLALMLPYSYEAGERRRKTS